MNAADIAIQALPTAFIMSGSVVVPARRTRLPIREAPMTIFTSATLAALITSNNCVSPAVAPVKVGISHHESGLNALAIHDNVTERRYAPTSAAEAVRPRVFARPQILSRRRHRPGNAQTGRHLGRQA